MFDPSTPEPPLISALRQVPTGSLYSLGDKAQLLSALELCRKGAVRPPQWDRGRTMLGVEVVGGRVREVVLTLEDGRVAVRCDCADASPAGSCRHSLAVLFTLKKALAPTTVSGWAPAEREVEAIRIALAGPALPRPAEGRDGKKGASRRPSPTWAVVVEERHGIPCIDVVRDGLPVLPFDRTVPGPLRPLLPGTGYFSSAPRPAAALATLLDRGGLDCQVFARQGGELLPLAIETAATRTGRLRFDAAKAGVRVSRVLDDGAPLGERPFWLGSWLVDLERGRVVRVAPPDAWLLWNDLVKVSHPLERGVRQIPWREFIGLELLTAAGDPPPTAEIELRVEGEEQPLVATALERYALEVDGGTGAALQLRGCARVGERELTLDYRALALFAEGLWEEVAPPLRAFKRRRVLYETFLAARAAATRKEQGVAVRRAMQSPDFRKRVVAREARELLKALFEIDREHGWHLTFADGRWQLLRRDRDREARLLEILFGHFGEPAFRGAPVPGWLQVDREAFQGRLPELIADLRQTGIELLFSGRPLEPVRLEIAVDAAATSIDWFELRSEIRCDGELLSDPDWRQALAAGMIEIGGRLRLLDAPSREALAVLADLGQSPARGRREVVRIPRLHILDCLALRRLGATLRLAPEDARILDSLERFETLPARPEPQLGTTLRDYQRLGYRWLAFLYEHKFGACLADDMGLGKTVQAISLLAALQQGEIFSRAPAGAPHLVVVPPTLLFNWESEIARFAPRLRTLLYRGQGRTTDFGAADVVLTSYDLVRRDIARLADIPFHVIIFDEAQAVKNVHAGVTAAVRRLQGTFKVALTGTPVENHLGEYWSIIDLVLPGLLGEYRRFRAPRADVPPEMVGRLIARTRPFLLRRTKEKIAAELPDKVEIDLRLELTDQQKALYRQTVAQVRQEVESAWRQQTAAQARITALAALMRLRRLCLDPRLVVHGGRESGSSPKIEALCEHLTELRDEGHAALVFSQFTTFLDLVEPALAAAEIPFLRLDGSTPVGERKKLVEKFQGSAEPLVFLLSLKAGGRGLNLTRATYVIHLDPWWNPAVENQASDRAHRIGQTRKVTVLRLLMRHTVEEKMMLLKERKQRLYTALLEDGRDGGGVPLTREDFEFLVGGERAQ